MATQTEVEAFIRDECARDVPLAEVLQHVQERLLAPAQRAQAVHVFPASHLASSLGQLCWCRGMIQEVQPEVHLFCASRQHFFDAHDDDSGTEAELLDAVSLYVIPVPGNDHYYSLEEATRLSGAAHVSSEGARHCERKRTERDASAEEEPEGPSTSATEEHRSPKQAKTTAAAETRATQPTAASLSNTTSSSLNFPHAARHPQLHTACIVTVLLANGSSQGTRGHPFRVNDVVDFYGFQHFPDDQLPVNEEDDFLRFSAWNPAELSKGLVSRLLCLAYTPVYSVHLPAPLRAAEHEEECAFDFAARRARALAYLAEHLTEGDGLTAEYVLLHLCARVRVHSETLPVGDLPLLVTAAEISPEVWSGELRRVSPVAEVLLTGDALRASGASFTPKYDNERNFLKTGVLQVANGSHVTVDCTPLDKRDGAWYEGLFALVHKQVLLLEYPYQTLELPVDVSILALSTALDAAQLHPLFQFALHVRCVANGAVPLKEAARHADAATEAAAMRAYVEAVRHLPTSSEALEASTAAQASAALLEMTAAIPGWNNRDPLLHNNSFSVATALMRAHAASHGRSYITPQDIAAVQRLEAARVERLAAPATGGG